MKAIKENERESRYRCDFSMEWAYFNKIDRFDCTLLNYNKNGGYLESAMGPLPGSTIFMRLKPCNDKNSIFLNRDHVRTATLARVEWCSPTSGKQPTSYAVGVKFFEYYDG